MTDNHPEAGAAGVPPGTLIAGKYRVERLLGEGAVGSVYLAKHPRLDLMLAVKFLQSSVAHDQQSVERFERGARNLSRVNHPHVCRLYDFGETGDGHLFLVMEYVEGDSLADLIEREGPMPAHRACQIVLHICRALHAAHETGIVHRDLKPGNVMIGRSASGQEIAKVVDFDIAKQAEPDIPAEVTQVGYVIGTPEYMSPEQLTGEELDGRSDLYSAGTILYRCLTGKLPFDKASTREIMLARLTEDPVPANLRGSPYPIPAGLQQVLDRSLMRDRNDRWADAAEMASAVANFTEGGYQSGQPTIPVLGGEATIAVPATQVAHAVPRAPKASAAAGASTRPSDSAPRSPMGRYAAIGAVGIAAIAIGAFALTQMTGNEAPVEVATVEPVEMPVQGAETTTTPPDPTPTPTDIPSQTGQPPQSGRVDTPDPVNQGGNEPPPAPVVDESRRALAQIESWNTTIDGYGDYFLGVAGAPVVTLEQVRTVISQARSVYDQQSYSTEVRGRAACLVAKGSGYLEDDVDAMASTGRWAQLGVGLYADQVECRTIAERAN